MRRTGTDRDPNGGAAARARFALSGRTAAVAGALWLALGVALGAFGAHTLQDLVTTQRLATFETGVRYQVYQGLGLLLLALFDLLGRGAPRAAMAVLLGSVVFSGSLYLLVAGAPGWFGAVAPVGGALMIFGWLLAAWRFARG